MEYTVYDKENNAIAKFNRSNELTLYLDIKIDMLNRSRIFNSFFELHKEFDELYDIETEKGELFSPDYFLKFLTTEENMEYTRHAEYIGFSESACISLNIIQENAKKQKYTIHFGEDGSYYTYMVTNRENYKKIKIPDNYELMMSFENVVSFAFEDDTRFTLINNESERTLGIIKRLNIYRRGEYDLIVELNY